MIQVVFFQRSYANDDKLVRRDDKNIAYLLFYCDKYVIVRLSLTKNFVATNMFCR